VLRLGSLLVLLAAPTPARDVCVPFADRVLTWDSEADLYVVATYTERAEPPARGAPLAPNLLELRRISTGAQLQLVNCALHADELGPGAELAPCDYRIEFARYLGGKTLRPHGARLDLGRFKVASVEEGGVRGQVLLVHNPRGGWQRLAWLEQQRADAPEKVTVRVVEGEKSGEHVDLVLSRRQRGGDCSHTSVRVLRLRGGDLEAPAAGERQAHLLAHLSSSSPLASWRTAAEVAPLPPERVLIGMVVAEEAGLPQLGARWWQETTAQLPVERVAPLVTALRERPDLERTRQLIKLPAQ
jgi:hypothetical protein